MHIKFYIFKNHGSSKDGLRPDCTRPIRPTKTTIIVDYLPTILITQVETNFYPRKCCQSLYSTQKLVFMIMLKLSINSTMVIYWHQLLHCVLGVSSFPMRCQEVRTNTHNYNFVGLQFVSKMLFFSNGTQHHVQWNGLRGRWTCGLLALKKLPASAKMEP